MIGSIFSLNEVGWQSGGLPDYKDIYHQYHI